MKNFSSFFTGIVCISIFFSCEMKEQSELVAHPPKLPARSYNYEAKLANAPKWFADTLVGTSNPTTNHGATLGRVLFYDPKLSLTNSVACGSCHHLSNGMSDIQSFSSGFLFGDTKRNAMPIINPAIERFFFWDSRVQTLEDMVLKPVQNHIEMGMENLDQLTTKLKTIDYYPDLFKKAFGTQDITKGRIADALAQFLRSIVTVNSKYDEGVKTNFANFTESENNGRNLFFNVLPCGTCHDKNNLGGFGTNIANVGLDIDYADNGVMDLNGNPSLEGDFRIPSLRNVALTAPYMHDGRFKTLEEVIQFYNKQIAANPNLSFPLDASTVIVTNHGYGNTTTVVIQMPPVVPIQLGLSDVQIKDLVAFLNTVTDDQFVNDEMYSDPFAY